MIKKVLLPIVVLFCLTILLFNYFQNKQHHPCISFETGPAYLKVQCWEQTANKIVKDEGVEKAFKLLPVFLAKNPDFGESCHEYLHQVGHYAYDYYSIYKKGNDVIISSSTSSCGYGFYHGLMSGVLAQGVSPYDAKMFCDFLQSKFGDTKEILLGNCYHGIGHGLLPANINWENPKLEIDGAIDNCKFIGKKYKECVIAVFGDISQKYISEVLTKQMPDYINHSIEEYGDIFKICQYFPDYLSECIPAFSSYGIDTTKQLKDLLTATSSLNEESRSYAITTIARTYSRKSGAVQNFSSIEDCMNLKLKSNTDSCMLGLISGKIETVADGQERDKGLEFCSTQGLNVNQKNICNENLSKFLVTYY